MELPTNGLTAQELIAVAARAGHTVTRPQLVRYHQHDVLPRPALVPQGRARGTASVYPDWSASQLVALRELLAKDRSLDRAAWALWWQGYSIEHGVIQRLLTGTLDALDEFRSLARYLGDDDSDDDEAGDAAWNKFDEFAKRLSGRSARLLVQGFGFNSPRDVLRIAVHIFDGNVPESFRPDYELTASSFAIPGAAAPTGMDFMPLFRLYAQALGIDRLRQSLAAASPQDLENARDAWRVLSFVFEEVVRLLFRRFAGSIYKGELLRQILVEAPELNRFAFLILLSYQRDPAFALGVRQALVDIKTPEAQRWLHQR